MTNENKQESPKIAAAKGSSHGSSVGLSPAKELPDAVPNDTPPVITTWSGRKEKPKKEGLLAQVKNWLRRRGKTATGQNAVPDLKAARFTSPLQGVKPRPAAARRIRKETPPPVNKLDLNKEFRFLLEKNLARFLQDYPSITQLSICQDFFTAPSHRMINQQRNLSPLEIAILYSLDTLRQLFEKSGIRRLILAQNNLNLLKKKVLEKVFETVKDTSIVELDLSFNNFTVDFDIFFAALPKLPPLQYLNLSYNYLEIEESILIISTTEQVQCINLSANKKGSFTEKQVEAMATAIYTCGKQVILDDDELGQAVEKKLRELNKVRSPAPSLAREKNDQAIIQAGIPFPDGVCRIVSDYYRSIPECWLNGPDNPPLEDIPGANESLAKESAKKENPPASSQTDFWRPSPALLNPSPSSDKKDNEDNGPANPTMYNE